MGKSIELYTLPALAIKLDKDWSYLRRMASAFNRGEIKEYYGYQFFRGGPTSNHPWFACDKDVKVELVDEGVITLTLP